MPVPDTGGGDPHHCKTNEVNREFFARRDELLSLWDIRTDGGSLKDNLAELLERAYRSLQENNVEGR